jgi:hypothetical protein
MTNALKIRQKFINLMYLVFILFAFIYAPTNSLDSLLFSTRSMKRTTNLMINENADLKNQIQRDTAFIKKHNDIYLSVMNVNDSIYYLINKLDSFQNLLIEPAFPREAGYPRHFRSASMSSKLFIFTNSAENLRLSLNRIKENLDKIGLKNIRENIDSILPTGTIIKNSKGADHEWAHFFFAKTPKAVLILTTEKIKNDLLNISRDMLNYLADIKNKENFKNKSPITNENTVFVVKLTKGEEVPIKLDLSNVSDTLQKNFFAEVAKRKLIGRLEKNGVDVSNATFNQKPMSPPPPVKEEKMYAFIGNGTFDELYLGVDNPIDISFSAPNGYKQEINVSEGELVHKNNNSFLRFKREGYTIISVYAVKGSTRKLLQQKEFKIILIPNPDVFLSGYKGGTISKDIVKVAKNIVLKNEGSFLPADVYNCESFDITLVPFDNPIGEIKVRGNSGTTFSSESKEMLKNVKRGDVIILDNFKILTAEGIVRRIPTVVYRVI